MNIVFLPYPDSDDYIVGFTGADKYFRLMATREGQVLVAGFFAGLDAIKEDEDVSAGTLRKRKWRLKNRSKYNAYMKEWMRRKRVEHKS